MTHFDIFYIKKMTTMTLLNNLARDDCSHPPPSPLATIAQMWLSPRARERGLLPHTRFGDWASTLNLAMVATPFATTVLTSASNPLSSSLCLLSFYFFYYISSFFHMTFTSITSSSSRI